MPETVEEQEKRRYLMAFDSVAKVWRRVKCNPEGELIAAREVVLNKIYSYEENLAQEQVIESGWIDVEGYDTIIIEISTDQNGELKLSFSKDALTEDFAVFFGAVSGFNEFRYEVVSKYLNIRYKNSYATTTFKLIAYVKV